MGQYNIYETVPVKNTKLSSSPLVIYFLQEAGYLLVNMGDMIFPTKILIYEDAQ